MFFLIFGILALWHSKLYTTEMLPITAQPSSREIYFSDIKRFYCDEDGEVLLESLKEYAVRTALRSHSGVAILDNEQYAAAMMTPLEDIIIHNNETVDAFEASYTSRIVNRRKMIALQCVASLACGITCIATKGFSLGAGLLNTLVSGSCIGGGSAFSFFHWYDTFIKKKVYAHSTKEIVEHLALLEDLNNKNTNMLLLFDKDGRSLAHHAADIGNGCLLENILATGFSPDTVQKINELANESASSLEE